MKTVLGLFDSRTKAENAISTLQDEGYETRDISIIMKDSKEAETIANNTGANVANETMAGATTGAVVGGLAGLVGSLLIPGLGAFLIGGPIAAALGLTGAAAATVSGAATGAVTGGLIGALTSMGLSQEEAQVYETQVNQGAILVAVPENEERSISARSILEDMGASDIKTITASDDYVKATRRSRTMADKHEDRDMDDVEPETDTRHSKVSFGN